VALEQVFSEYFSFSCQSPHRLLHVHYRQTSGADTIGQIVAGVPSELILTPPQGKNGALFRKCVYVRMCACTFRIIYYMHTFIKK
jgi:hypothetical protein